MMNNALSDIFHNQTALTRERLSFCEANIKDLNEWVTTLLLCNWVILQKRYLQQFWS